MQAEGDVGGNESEKIAVNQLRKEKREGESPIQDTQLASGRTSSSGKIQEVVDVRDSGGYEEAGNQ